MAQNPTFIKGGEFLIKDSEMSFIPGHATEDEKMIIDSTKAFLEQKLSPNIEHVEKQKDGVSQQLMVELGELGLLGIHIPEAYGGVELDVNTSTIFTEIMSVSTSFNTTMAAHTGIGMLPILYYGSEELKKEYLPKLCTGKDLAAYCLTEPTSGSDALSAKTVAMPIDGGEYYEITGQKMWITNAAWASVFTVFAQVDGDKFTGFLVDADSEGLTLGEEEDKLGIKGSSTRQVYFDKVKVHKSHILGEIGRGHLIAFNSLNIGRFKLGVFSSGGCRYTIREAVRYANERQQFKQPISNFGAIKYKLAEMFINTVAVESSAYRISDLMNQFTIIQKEEGVEYGEAKRAAAEEFAVECSILKVAGSEVATYCTDEYVQIMGGMGFSEEGKAARLYRDIRITRIYEGTNEINRLLIVDMILKRAMKGKLDIVGPAWEVQKELKAMPKFENLTEELAQEYKAINDFKKVILMVAGAAAKEQMEEKLNLQNEQMLLTYVSDIIIDTYNAESLYLRLKEMKCKGDEDYDLVHKALQVFLHAATGRIRQNAIDAVAYFTTGDVNKIFGMGIKRFTSYPTQNVIQLRREIANVIIEKNSYPINNELMAKV